LQQETITHPSDPFVDQKDKRVSRLIDFLHAHFKKDLSLQQIAEEVRLNPFHVVRLFKKTVGISPYEYLLVIRTEYAKRLLRQGYKVHEAALEAGFYDTSHFNRLLRKFAGTSPKSFLSSKGQYCTSFTD
jgi:AraC-like DNA-binding protein